jgi:hypothetical protein
MLQIGDIALVSAICRHSWLAAQCPTVWAGKRIRIHPRMLQSLAPVLNKWLHAWVLVDRLVVPQSQQLLAELEGIAPSLPVEVAWRFHEHLHGQGVQLLEGGTVARRTGKDDLVVIGDAPLRAPEGRQQYFEVVLDERGDDFGDGLNDFGIGVTACPPTRIKRLGAVADEVPRSWIVDFTRNSVILAVNNESVAQGYGVSSEDFKDGDRVGLLLGHDRVEVFLNGASQERFDLETQHTIPSATPLFPVLDMYGRAARISCSDADAPDADACSVRNSNSAS